MVIRPGLKSNLTAISVLLGGSFGSLLAPPLIGEAQAQSRRNQDCYVTFWPKNGPDIEIEICQDRGVGAKSGTAYLSNHDSRTFNVCVDLMFDDAKQIGWCESSLRPGDEVSYSCYRCSEKSGGPAIDARWRKVQPQ